MRCQMASVAAPPRRPIRKVHTSQEGMSHRISYVTRSQLFTSAPRYVWGQESAQKAHGILWIHNIPWIRFGAFGLRASTWRR